MLDTFQADYPQVGDGYLLRAILLRGGSGPVGKEAFDAAGKALEFGIHKFDRRVLAHQFRAIFYLGRGDGAAAEAELDAIFNPSTGDDPNEISPYLLAELHKLRSQSYRRQKQYEKALAEIEHALQWAITMSSEQMIQEYAAEKAVIQKHAGRSLPVENRESAEQVKLGG